VTEKKVYPSHREKKKTRGREIVLRKKERKHVYQVFLGGESNANHCEDNGDIV